MRDAWEEGPTRYPNVQGSRTRSPRGSPVRFPNTGAYYHYANYEGGRPLKHTNLQGRRARSPHRSRIRGPTTSDARAASPPRITRPSRVRHVASTTARREVLRDNRGKVDDRNRMRLNAAYQGEDLFGESPGQESLRETFHGKVLGDELVDEDHGTLPAEHEAVDYTRRKDWFKHRPFPLRNENPR